MENTGSIKMATVQITTAGQTFKATNFQTPSARTTYQEAMKNVEGIKKNHIPVVKKTGIMGELERIGKKLHIIA